MMKKIEIEIPDDCILVQDGDKYIIKKEILKPRSWEEFCKRYPVKDTEYYIDSNSIIHNCGNHSRNKILYKNMCTSKQEAEAFLALMQLRQLRKAWIGDWIQPGSNSQIGFITYSFNRRKLVTDYGYTWRNSVLSFPNREMAQEFLDCFKDLCETAKILL